MAEDTMSNKFNEENDDELYGDLDIVTSVTKSTASSKKKIKTALTGEEGVDYYEASVVEKLRKELEESQRANSTLKRNIAILYRTAKAEIERKDATLQSLQDRLDRLERRG